jgi:hypothetical protein
VGHYLRLQKEGNSDTFYNNKGEPSEKKMPLHAHLLDKKFLLSDISHKRTK